MCGPMAAVVAWQIGGHGRLRPLIFKSDAHLRKA